MSFVSSQSALSYSIFQLFLRFVIHFNDDNDFAAASAKRGAASFGVTAGFLLDLARLPQARMRIGACRTVLRKHQDQSVSH